MKKNYLFMGILGLALLSSEKKETDTAIYFGGSLGDGYREEAEESLHFGTSSGSG